MNTYASSEPSDLDGSAFYRKIAKATEIFLGCRAFRLAAAVGTGLWAGERSREASGMACLKLLVALPTPLGGEVASLVRERDPNHIVLKSASPSLLCVVFF